MNLFVNECRCNSIESQEAAIKSSDEPSQSSEDNINEDYYRARNYNHRRNYADHKACILDRAYRLIYDVDFSTEITSESDLSGENYITGKNLLEGNLDPGDGTGVFLHEERFDKSKSGNRSDYRSWREYLQTKRRGVEVSNFSKTQRIGLTNQRNSTGNRENIKTRSGPKICAKNIENFGETWRKASRNEDASFLKRSSSFYWNNLDTRKFDSDSQSPSLEKTVENQSRKFYSKRNSKKNSNLGPSTFRRKRKFPSVESQGGFNCREDPRRRRRSEENSSRPLKPRDRLKRISKMRKMYSEKISFNKTREENNESLVYDVESSSSDDRFVIEVEKILRGNTRGKKNCFAVETVLLENKNRNHSNFLSLNKIERRKSAFSCDKYTTNAKSNEVKLLEDIKKRIDEDFECDSTRIKAAEKANSKIVGEESSKVISSLESRILNKNGASSASDKFSNSNILKSGETNDPVNTGSKSSTNYFVDSIDSGVSTDFSRTESDNLSKNDRCLEKKTPFGFSNDAETPVSQHDQDYRELVAFFNYSNDLNDEKILDEQVDKAVRRFTEELIICERRAVDRGLIDESRNDVARKVRKSFKKVSHSDSSSPRSPPNTFLSPREFSKTSQSSSEDEYLENISPPSLCSISDSEIENFHDFYEGVSIV